MTILRSPSLPTNRVARPRRGLSNRSRGYIVRTDTETWAALCATTSTRSTLHMTMELSG